MSGGAVDTKTVEMRFDNSDFEKNAKQSMSTLEKLKRALKLDGASAGLKEIEQASKKVDFKHAEDSVDGLGKKFNALEKIASGFFKKIGASIADKAMAGIKQITIDPIISSWDKYEEKTNAVQTIMANLRDTENKFVDDAAKMGYVNSYLEKLMWFSDETSYKFTDMTSNIGKFIANGQNLEDSVTAMQGIATWAAISGQRSDAAARAMYNISQAMGTGSMKMLDWRSIENANMATAEFKETAINAAVAMGKLKEGQVTVESFRDSLQKGWFDKDVMMDVFKTYGEAAEKIQEYALANEVSSTEAIRMLKKQDKQFAKSLGFRAFAAAQEAKTFRDVMEGTADAVSTKMMKIFENIFGNYLEAKELWTDLSEQLWEIIAAPLDDINAIMKKWKRGFFMDGPIDSLETLFERGYLDQLETGLHFITEEGAYAAVAADGLTYSIVELEDGTRELCKTVTDASGKTIKGYKTIFKADERLVSGRTALLEGFQNIFDTFVHDVENENGVLESMSFFGSLKRGLQEAIFGTSEIDKIIPIVSRKLWDLTNRFKDFTEKLKPSMETSLKLKNAFKGLFSLFKIGGKFVKAVTKPFKELIQNIFKKKDGSKGLLDLADSMGTWIQKLDQYLEKNKVFDKVSEKVRNGFDSIKTGVNNVVKSVTGMTTSDLGEKIKTKVFGFFENYNFKETFGNVVGFFRNIIDQIKNVNTDKLSGKLTPLQNFWIGFKNIFSAIKQFISLMAPAFAAIGVFINKAITSIAEAISNKKIENASSKGSSIWEKITGVFSKITGFFKNIYSLFTGGGSNLGKIGERLGDFFAKFKEGISKLFEGKSIEEIINSLVKGGFFISLTNFLNKMSSLKLSNTFMLFNISGGIKGLKDVLKAYKREINASTLLTIAATIAVLAGSMWLLAKIPSDKIIQAGVALLGLAGVVLAIAFAIEKIRNVMSKGSDVAGEGIFGSLEHLLKTTVKSSIFANDATAKFVKIAAGILMAAIAALVIVKAVGKVGEVIQQLAKIPPPDIQKGGTIFAQILLVLGAFSLLAGFSRHSTSVLFAAIAAYIVVDAIIKLVNYIALLGTNYKKMTAIQIVAEKFKGVFIAIKEIALLVLKIFAAITIAQLAIEAFSTGKESNTLGMAKVLKQFGKNFMRIALSLMIVAAAFAVMGFVAKQIGDPGNVKAIAIVFVAFIAIVAVLEGLVVGFVSMKKFTAAKTSAIGSVMKSLGLSFMMIAASLAILAVAFGLMAQAIQHTTPGQFDNIVNLFGNFTVVVGVIMLLATSMAMAASYGKHPRSIAGNLLAFGGAFAMIAASMAILAVAFGLMAQAIQHTTPGQFDNIVNLFGNFTVAVGVIMVLVTAMSMAASYGKHPRSIAGNLLAFGGAFMMIAASMAILAVAFGLMAQAIQYTTPSQFNDIVNLFGNFTVAVGVIMGIVTGMFTASSFGKHPGSIAVNLLAFGTAFAMIAGSMVILAFAFNLMAESVKNVSADQFNDIVNLFGNFTVAVGVIMVLATAMLTASSFGKHPGSIAVNLLAFGATFVLIAGSMAILAYAFKLMAEAMQNVSQDQFNDIAILFGGFIVLTGVLAVLGAIFGQNIGSIIGMAAMTGMILATAVSLAIVVAAFALLASVSSPEQMDKVMYIIIALGAVIAALSIIGAIIGATGVGLLGLAAITGVILAFGAACLMIGAGLLLAALGFSSLADSISNFIEVVADKGPKFAESIEAIVNAILDTIINSAPKAFTAIVAIINLIIQLAPLLAIAGAELLIALAQGLASASGKLAAAGTLILLTFVENFFETLSVLVPPLVEGLIDAIDTLADTVRANAGAFWDAGMNLFEALLEGIFVGVAKLGSWIPGVGDEITGIMERDLFPKMRKWFNIPEEAREYTSELQAFDAGEEGAGVAKPNTEGAAAAGKAEAQAYTAAAKSELDAGSKDFSAYKGKIYSQLGLGGEEGGFKFSTEGMTDGGIMSVLSSFIGADGNLPGLNGGSLNIMEMLGVKDFDFSQFTAGMGDAFAGMDFKQYGIDNMAQYGQGIEESKDTVKLSSEEVAEVVAQPVESLDSKSWGTDLVSLLAQGITDATPLVETACTGVASVIKSILGFSEPEAGPLSDFHTYAPDMIDLWCSGIRSNLGSIESSTTEVADTVYDGFSAALDYVSGLIDNGMSDQLTIRPVMDLTEIQNGADSMRRLISSADGYEIDGTTRLAASTAYNMHPVADVSSTEPLPGQTDIGPTSNTFYITSNDPDAVAEKVSKILSSQTRRQKAVWAR
jgi:tape measure domain-containing protein